jgi:murein DD-endopeptidase MepM/ murein hydrolase activator NlpD
MKTVFLVLIIAAITLGGIYIWKTQGKNLGAVVYKIATSTVNATTTAITSTISAATSSKATSTPPKSSAPQILVLKSILYQGDPLYIAFSSGTPSAATFNDKQMFIFQFKGSAHAIAPIPPAQAPGNYIISALYPNGHTIQKTVHIYKYNFVVIKTTPFVSTTSPEEEAQLEAETLDFQSSFKNPTLNPDFAATFVPPLHSPLTIVSPFGEVRDFGTYKSVHLGVDFRAPVGTPVYAVNDGVVIKVKNYLDYGSVIVVDHGAGIYSVYMHLSRADVKTYDRVYRNQQIGATGATGFVSGPHLHLSIRIGDFSVDPMRFFPTVK